MKKAQSEIKNTQQYNFNLLNKENGVPEYKDFIKAFEKYSNLKRGQFEVQHFEHTILFKTKEETFEISTSASLTCCLRNYIETESYEEIYTQTDENIWGDIYVDAGIPKSKFIPQMQKLWEDYWDKLYKEVKEKVGRTEHLDEGKEKSWRTIISFIALYEEDGDIIQLAYDFDEMILYPIAVITMMRFFSPEACYDEYCEEEFCMSNEWESIVLDEEDDYSNIFYIKKYEL